ncbi:MAG TPA: Slp family lipoprotein [Desulfuromonadaceae bacterium]
MRVPLRYILPLVFLLAGCSHWISTQSRAAADQSISFSQLRENPDAYRGKYVLLGGTVATAEQDGEGTRLEVVEHRLDSRELPDRAVPSQGRFLATTAWRLDPVTYKSGTLVSMMGEVAGSRTRLLEGMEYTYPVISVREIHAIELPEIHPEYDYGNRHHFLHPW